MFINNIKKNKGSILLIIFIIGIVLMIKKNNEKFKNLLGGEIAAITVSTIIGVLLLALFIFMILVFLLVKFFKERF